MSFPEQVGPDELADLIRRSAAAEADLRFVGLPVVQGGDCRDGNGFDSSTFVVYYDSSTDTSGGVFVIWKPSAEVKKLVVTSPQLALQRAIPLGSAALEAMTVVAVEVLTAAGWEIDRANIGVHESSIKVLSPLSKK